MEDKRKTIRVGSRKSELALIQTRYVISLLKDMYPDIQFEIVTMSTLGDQILDKPLPKIGEKALFTKELEVALAASFVDFVVHSLKDLPTCLPEGMAIGAVLKREDPRDALVLAKEKAGLTLATLKEGSVIGKNVTSLVGSPQNTYNLGTSSLRRTAQLSRLYPHLKIENIRGNLNTRLRKLDDLELYSAIMLARAGLTRMGWENRISQVLDCSEILYAVGQGALAVECRDSDLYILNRLAPLNHSETLLSVLAERSFLKTLGGGCSAPVAVHSVLDVANCKLKLTGAVWSLDGKIKIESSATCSVHIDQDPTIFTCTEKPSQLTNSKIHSQSTSENNSGKVETETICPLNNKDRQDKSTCSLTNAVSHDHTQHAAIRKCPYECNNVSKKLKSDEHVESLEKSSIDVSKLTSCPYIGNSSEEGCPVSSLPVGIDFMGKCPYLNTEGLGKCPVNAKILSSSSQTDQFSVKCPFIHNDIDINTETFDIFQQPENAGIERCTTYCGITANKFVSQNVLETTEQLGSSLANCLIKKGALNVMQEAQNVIRNATIE